MRSDFVRKFLNKAILFLCLNALQAHCKGIIEIQNAKEIGRLLLLKTDENGDLICKTNEDCKYPYKCKAIPGMDEKICIDLICKTNEDCKYPYKCKAILGMDEKICIEPECEKPEDCEYPLKCEEVIHVPGKYCIRQQCENHEECEFPLKCDSVPELHGKFCIRKQCSDDNDCIYPLKCIDHKNGEGHVCSTSTQDPLKILQINLARAKASTNQLHLTASTIKPDIILVQEQYHYNNEIRGIPNSWKTFSSTNQKAAILIPSAQIKPALLATKVNVVAVKIQTSSYPITIISAYSSPAQDVSTTLQEIQEIITSLPEEKIIIGADLNGHNTLWGYRSNDNRGNEVLDFILANNLYILNKSDAPPTFQRNNSIGWPDLTLCSQSIIDSSINWEVLDDISLSDHRYIQTTIASTIANQFYKRYKTRHGNHPRFLNILGKDIYYLENKIATARNSRELNDATIVLQNSIINACNKTFKIKKQLLLTKPNWWTEKLEINKKKVRALRKRAQRAPEIEKQWRYQIFKKEKTEYKKHIKKAKNTGWRNFCSSASNPYGKHYKAAFRKSVFPSQIPYLMNSDPKGSLKEAAQNHLGPDFPSPAISTNYNLNTSTQPLDPPFSIQEISMIIDNLPSGKAPECNCAETQECFLNEHGEADCRCPSGETEFNVDGVKTCVECNCAETQECFLNEQKEADCRCPSGKTEFNVDGVKTCVECNCAESQECFLNEHKEADCRCLSGKTEFSVDGVKTCVECNCAESQECFLNEHKEADCRCLSGKTEFSVDGVKTCVECNCAETQECFLNEHKEADCRCLSGKTEFSVDGVKTCVEFQIILLSNEGATVFPFINDIIFYFSKECNCTPTQECFVNDQKAADCRCPSGKTEFEVYGVKKCFDCYCGENSNSCYFDWKGNKICNCSHGYAENHEHCDECNCGPYGSCSFQYGRKHCDCISGKFEKNGMCVDCECGIYSYSCFLDSETNKVCNCYFGYSQLGGLCEECNCGPYGTCSFEYGRKKCNCRSFATEMNGVCVEMDTSSKGTTDSLIMSTILSSTVQECDCGENSKSCRFDWKGKKICDCISGYAQIDEFCKECNCGVNVESCFFRRNGTKACHCDFGYIQINGHCAAICNEDKILICFELSSENGLSEKLNVQRQLFDKKIYNLYTEVYEKHENLFEESLQNNAACSCTNGECLNEGGKQVCKCKPGFGNYTRSLCKACDCGPDSNCTWISKGFFNTEKVCLCKLGYHEEKSKCVGPCTKNPCMNGGICKDVENGYECICPSKFTGDNCKDKVTPCTATLARMEEIAQSMERVSLANV
ncbi:Delta and Notch-like epidermal growth [Argiope bruennichi]|uniref:Delta and Notch-like epidermal growth n=1 Tax=Argiope bruennichi TaxID=94029 RepID=A0A8T0EQ64_ARGBR|nr:Delta and Notch-like epidermal growth [Argiope bruennichi]